MWGYSEHQYGVQWRGGQGRASEGIGWLALKVVSIRFMERKTMQWCRAKQCKARFKFSINPSRNWKPLFNFCPNLEFWTSDLLAVRNAYFLGQNSKPQFNLTPKLFIAFQTHDRNSCVSFLLKQSCLLQISSQILSGLNWKRGVSFLFSIAIQCHKMKLLWKFFVHPMYLLDKTNS